MRKTRVHIGTRSAKATIEFFLCFVGSQVSQPASQPASHACVTVYDMDLMQFSGFGRYKELHHNISDSFGKIYHGKFSNRVTFNGSVLSSVQSFVNIDDFVCDV